MKKKIITLAIVFAAIVCVSISTSVLKTEARVAPTDEVMETTNVIETEVYKHSSNEDECAQTNDVDDETETGIPDETVVNEVEQETTEENTESVDTTDVNEGNQTTSNNSDECETDVEEVVSVFDEMAEKEGMVGRLTIPYGGVNVALYSTTVYDISESQSIVDAYDSAAYMEDGYSAYNCVIIADHVHQGFVGIKSAVPGSTYAYIDFGECARAYVCTRNLIGYNTGYLVDGDGNYIVAQDSEEILMYTCNSDGSVTITFWKSA